MSEEAINEFNVMGQVIDEDYTFLRVVAQLYYKGRWWAKSREISERFMKDCITYGLGVKSELYDGDYGGYQMTFILENKQQAAVVLGLDRIKARPKYNRKERKKRPETPRQMRQRILITAQFEHPATTQADLAKALGVTPQRVSQLCKQYGINTLENRQRRKKENPNE